MSEELETVLRLVAEGKLSPAEASPIIEALSRAQRAGPGGAGEPGGMGDRIGRRIDQAFARAEQRLADTDDRIEAFRGRQLRIRVTEHGRQVVNLRIPIGFVDTALQFVPGISGEQAQRIRDAVDAGTRGPILDVDDPDGSGVLISIE